jgi:DNA-binding transcriptional LysR family regulator
MCGKGNWKPPARGLDRVDAPVMISEGVTSIWEATRKGFGVSILPDWFVQDDIVSGCLM